MATSKFDALMTEEERAQVAQAMESSRQRMLRTESVDPSGPWAKSLILGAAQAVSAIALVAGDSQRISTLGQNLACFLENKFVPAESCEHVTAKSEHYTTLCDKCADDYIKTGNPCAVIVENVSGAATPWKYAVGRCLCFVVLSHCGYKDDDTLAGAEQALVDNATEADFDRIMDRIRADANQRDNSN